MAGRFRKKKRIRSSRTARPVPVVWQLDVTEPEATADGEPACTVMLVDTSQPEPLAVEVCLPAQVPDVLASTLRDASQARVAADASPWPDRIEVRLEALGRFLASLGQREVLEIEVTERLAALEAATLRLMARLDDRHVRCYIPDLPAALYEAAADVVEAAPWTHYGDRHVLELAVEGGGEALPWSAVTILGGSGLVRGLSLYPDRARCAALAVDGGDAATDDALNVWFRDGAAVSELEAELFRVDGWPRTDLYPAVSRLRDGALHAPDDAEVDAIIDALEAVLLFVDEHPEPPAPDTRVLAEWHDGGLWSVRHRPLLEDLEAAVDLRALAPFDLQASLLDIGGDALAAFDAQLEPVARLAPDVLAQMPARVVVLALRARKPETQGLIEALDALEVDALGFASGRADGAIVAWSGARVVGRLFGCDAAFAGALSQAASSLEGRLIVVFSGGGTRLKAGRVRGRDALAMRWLGWRRD